MTLKPTDCPQCHRTLSTLDDEFQWCDFCEWNLNPFNEDIDQRSPLKIYRRYERTLAQNLLRKVIQSSSQRHSFSSTKAIAYLNSSLIHSISLLLAIAAMGTFSYWPHASAILGTVLLGAVAVITRPRLSRWPKEVLSRNQFPNLYGFVDRICEKMGASPFHGIVVDSHFNASYTEYGIGPWKKKLLTLGLPLIEAIENEELAAIVGHEIGHGQNGDLLRGIFVGHALSTLKNWHYIWMPTSLFEGNHSIVGIIMFPFNVARVLVASLFDLNYRFLLILLRRQSQEAEYFADRAGAQIVGKDVFISGLQKTISVRATVDIIVQRAALNNSPTKIFEEIRKLRGGPGSNLFQNTFYKELRTGQSLDSTHPPTLFRIHYLKSVHVPYRNLELNSNIYFAVRKELESLHDKISQELIDAHLSEIYPLR